MSTIPESTYKLQDNKMLVSFTLKIPLQFEIELQGIQDTNFHQVNHQQSLKSAINPSSDLIINEINQAEIEKKTQILSNQLAIQILSQINESKASSENPSNPKEDLDKLPEKDILNTSLKYSEDKLQSNKEVISTTIKQRKRRFADSLNDSLTLAANLVGTILFLGKVANYSWEE